MGTLYIVGAPATGPDDLTIRGRRILGSVPLVVSAQEEEGRRFLDSCGISAPLVPAAAHERVLAALAESDVALLQPGQTPVPGSQERGLLGAALAAGFAVVPVPGPAEPLTALVLSGLPADSFLYLGALPPEPVPRRSLLESMAAEPTTLVLLAGAGELPDLLLLLHATWGDRPLVLWPAASGEPREVWRGSLDGAMQVPETLDAEGDWVLVVGGAAQEEGQVWEEDRLREEIRAGLRQGLGVGQVSRELALPSGWARRDVYRLAVDEHERMGRG